MKDEYLNAMEPAARMYCAKVGIDPEVNIPVPHERLQGVMVNTRMWQVIAEKMIDLTLMLAAMKEAAAVRAANDTQIIVEH